MSNDTIRFDDGEAYEQYMGIWSRSAGHAFLDWLSVPDGGRWLDVGCGNGVFSELIVELQKPESLDGIDPAAAQIAFAQARPGIRMGTFCCGDAQALPYDDASFDQSVMALVIFFLPDPAQGVAEMARVTALGGMVSAYAWDMPGGGFPYAILQKALTQQGLTPLKPPSADVATPEQLTALWENAGLCEVETTTLIVERRYASFEQFWRITQQGPSLVPVLGKLDEARLQALREAVCADIPAQEDGSVVLTARAFAVKGRKG